VGAAAITAIGEGQIHAVGGGRHLAEGREDFKLKVMNGAKAIMYQEILNLGPERSHVLSGCLFFDVIPLLKEGVGLFLRPSL
jgi:hypothetical protein